MSIVHIARQAGVSTATVSRVLNNSPGVRDETKSQVQAAVKALKYVSPLVKRGPRPGSSGRSANGDGKSLARIGRSHRKPALISSIAVVAVGSSKDWLQMPVMAAAFGSIARAAGGQGIGVFLDEMWDCHNLSPALRNADVQGVIAFLSSNLKPAEFRDALLTLQQKVPVVWAMGGDAGITSVDHVIPDDRAISRLAFDYLADNGCRELAFITQNPDWAMMRNRGQYFAGLAHDAGINWSAYLVSDHPRDGELFGARATVAESLEMLVDKIAAASPRPDGIFLGNDDTAALVHPMLLQRGILLGEKKMGREILLVSCDNEQVRLGGLVPRPLSIDIGSAEVGAVALRRLRFRIEHPGEPPVLIKVAPFVPGPAMDAVDNRVEDTTFPVTTTAPVNITVPRIREN